MAVPRTYVRCGKGMSFRLGNIFDHMNLRQLRYFVGVIDAGNMTRAAEQLHVAQTALGMQIRQLEEDLGVACWFAFARRRADQGRPPSAQPRACDFEYGRTDAQRGRGV